MSAGYVHDSPWEAQVKGQFTARCADFERSASWIADPALIGACVDLAGAPSGEALDLCCGTGVMGRALKAAGWEVTGLDLTDTMIAAASRHFPVVKGSASSLPFDGGRFRLVVCRQSFQFFPAAPALREIARVLAPGGSLVLSHTVPFSEGDRPWLEKIHRFKQPLLLHFHTEEDLDTELAAGGFAVAAKRRLSVRESITRWMAFAPELSDEIRAGVCALIEDAPPEYRIPHRVEKSGEEIFEDWCWVLWQCVPARAEAPHPALSPKGRGSSRTGSPCSRKGRRWA